jgi:membrane protein YdbS with pleckstrin-like domain
MLTTDEEKFMLYWKQARLRKKNLIWQMAAGLPLAVFMAGAIFVTYFSDWYKRAIVLINMSSSGVLVVLLGLLLTVVFIVVFSARHKWEMNEQHYNELLVKKDLP